MIRESGLCFVKHTGSGKSKKTTAQCPWNQNAVYETVMSRQDEMALIDPTSEQTMSFHSGATLGGLVAKVRALPEDLDVLIVQSFCNQMFDDGCQDWRFKGVNASYEKQLEDLAALAKQKARRPFFILGGTSTLWGCDPKFDQAVNLGLAVLRARGVPASNGEYWWSK